MLRLNLSGAVSYCTYDNRIREAEKCVSCYVSLLKKTRNVRCNGIIISDDAESFALSFQCGYYYGWFLLEYTKKTHLGIICTFLLNIFLSIFVEGLDNKVTEFLLKAGGYKRCLSPSSRVLIARSHEVAPDEIASQDLYPNPDMNA